MTGRRTVQAQVAIVVVALIAALVGPAPGAAALPIGTPNQLSTFNPPQTLNDFPDCGTSAIAYNATSQKTLATWVAPDAGSPNDGVVQMALVSSVGALGGSVTNVSSGLPSGNFYNCDPTAVVAGPSGGWLVLYLDENESAVYGQRVSSSGALVGDNFVVSSNTDYDDIETVSAAWSPESNRYLVTWKADVGTPFPAAAASEQLVGRFIGSNGAGIGSDFLVTNDADGINNSQDLAFGNGRWIVVAATYDTSTRRVVGQVITTAGLQGGLFDVSSGAGSGATRTNGPSIVYNEATGEFLTAFVLPNASPKSSATRVLSSTGVPQGSDLPLSSEDPYRIRLASAGKHGYLAVWHTDSGSEFQVVGTELDLDGQPTGSVQPLAPAAPVASWRPAVTFNAAAGNYLVNFAMNPNSPDETNFYGRAWVLPSAQKPGRVQGLKVRGASTAAQRLVTWRAPITGASVTKYLVRVYLQRTNKLAYAASTTPPRTSVKIPKAALLRNSLRSRGDVGARVLRYRVEVWARSTGGAGPTSTTRMLVRY